MINVYHDKAIYVLHKLVCLAKEQDFRFDANNYEWVIGVDVLNYLMSMYFGNLSVLHDVDNEGIKLLDIIVTLDYKNRSRISLLKEVERND